MEELTREDFLDLGKTKQISFRGKKIRIRELGGPEWMQIVAEKPEDQEVLTIWLSLTDSLPKLKKEDIRKLPRKHIAIIYKQIDDFYDEINQKKEESLSS